jgi:hypothetical protein
MSGRTSVLVLLVAGLSAHAAEAQYRGPRSADYLFSASASGVRALWLNPAGLGTVHEASLMAEVMVERNAAGDYPLAQYTVGFNSRGASFGFRRDRFGNGVAGNTWRLGFGRGVGNLAAGAAVTLYSGQDRKEDLDLGVRLRAAPAVEFSLGVEHIGQPVVRDSSLRFGGTAGVAWQPFGNLLLLAGEARATHATDGGVLMAYRAGVTIQTAGRIPIGVLAVLDLDKDLRGSRLVAGFSVGGPYQGLLVGSGTRRNDVTRVETASVTAIASQHF